MEHMEQLRVSHLKSRVSLVVGVVDSLTSQSPLGNTTTVHLEGTRSKAIRKTNGSYIFNDLTPGTYLATVTSEYYFQEQVRISIGSTNAIAVVQLSPKPSYPFSPGTPLIRMMLHSSAGTPLQGAELQAVVQSEDGARARLMTEQAERGSEELTLGSFTGGVLAGDTYLLRGRGGKASEEMIRIAEVLEHQKRFRLMDKLTKAYARGALLMPVQMTRSTERGEVVIAFRGNRIPDFTADLMISYGSASQQVIKEVAVAEGATTNLGTVCLTQR
ncbi:DUF2012 domain-containing protein [Paenibacillus whitsoniae]|uniref:DUF2012 domain-containing protein n=1 Tax=Paenibacillus whitsoniae TaxID=2496558 RepID=A0A3S0A4J5_9BACL|nr:DUF2012 domain-containing protein [Paenibacillus whitsoniae]RTE09435.1 DUF2012 domain-containing protein [Paenibacillus whitsoniae]